MASVSAAVGRNRNETAARPERGIYSVVEAHGTARRAGRVIFG
jgi:hypothetical protein